MLLDPHFLLFEVGACVFLKSHQTDEGGMEGPGTQELREWSLPAFLSSPLFPFLSFGPLHFHLLSLLPSFPLPHLF